MSTASPDRSHQLRVLREHLLHPTDYELAVSYFLQEFGADAAFLEQGMDDRPAQLLAVLRHVAAKLLGVSTDLETARVLNVPELGCYHGSAFVEERALIFFYLREADTGVMAMMPGRKGGMEVARFRLMGGLADPRNN